MTTPPTPDDYIRSAWELLELARAGVSRHPAGEKVRKAIEEHGPHSSEALHAAMAGALGMPDLRTRQGMGGREWVYETEQSWRSEIPSFYMDRARRLLDPDTTPPDYVDAYSILSCLCPSASHEVLDRAARQIADSRR